MENKRKSYSILVIILIILVLGLGGFIVYDKVLKEDKTINNENSNSENSNNENQNVSEISNSFELFKNNLIKERNEKYDSASESYLESQITATVDGNRYSLSLSKDGVLQLSMYGENSMTRTISDEVLLFTLADVGNGGLKSVYFIKEDGTVSSWFVEGFVLNNEDREVENNIGNFKNIINIIPGIAVDTVPGSPIQSAAAVPAFVDINGNIFVPFGV